MLKALYFFQDENYDRNKRPNRHVNVLASTLLGEVFKVTFILTPPGIKKITLSIILEFSVFKSVKLIREGLKKKLWNFPN